LLLAAETRTMPLVAAFQERLICEADTGVTVSPVGIDGLEALEAVEAGTFSSAPPPHPKSPKTASNATNVRYDALVTTTPRLLATA
jgi:hypothetical protein